MNENKTTDKKYLQHIAKIVDGITTLLIKQNL